MIVIQIWQHFRWDEAGNRDKAADGHYFTTWAQPSTSILLSQQARDLSIFFPSTLLKISLPGFLISNIVEFLVDVTSLSLQVNINHSRHHRHHNGVLLRYKFTIIHKW